MSIFSYTFFQHAILAAFFCSVACGIIGSLVVLNRLSYMAGAIAHAAYGGIGLAFMFRLPVLPCTMGFSLAASLGMAWLASHKPDDGLNRDPDTAIGILWAAGMAFGVILIELSPGYAGDMTSFLFGSILAVPTSNLLLMAGLDLLLLVLLYFFHQGFTALSFDPDFARARGLPTRWFFFLLVGMTSVVVVMMLQVVGLLLVIALMTIPPHMARRCSNSLPQMMLTAFILCFIFCMLGLWLAWVFDLSSGALIIAVATTAYTVQHIVVTIQRKIRCNAQLGRYTL